MSTPEQTAREAIRAAVYLHADECRRRMMGSQPTDPYAGPSLRGADLSGLDLFCIDLRGADLSGACLNATYLQGAKLEGTDFRWASLLGAILASTDLRGANLEGANLDSADMQFADLAGAILPDGVPAIPNIDAEILRAIEEERCVLNMSLWHQNGDPCGTTHCRAGMAVHLAGQAGHKLEKRFGPGVAGALIYAASGSHPVPEWFTDDQTALADMRARAFRLASPPSPSTSPPSPVSTQAAE